MEDESKKEKSTLLKLNLRCRRAARLKIKFFARERRRAGMLGSGSGLKDGRW